ncbi:MAG: hypothetical protein JSS26_20240 [Nitrospira sp.]|nr:hypothetical protein [Nitrospira sp.]
MQDEKQKETDRLSSDLLPATISTVANLSLLAGAAIVIYAVTNNALWLLSIGVYGVVASPFLYGFADIVRSLRSIARNTQKT